MLLKRHALTIRKVKEFKIVKVILRLASETCLYKIKFCEMTIKAIRNKVIINEKEVRIFTYIRIEN